MARILSRTRDGIDRVTRIVHSLRGMARTDAPQRQEARIPDLINNSLEILHGKFKRLGVVVEQTHDPNPVVSCVPTQISQVVLNLLVNAFQAIEASPTAADGRIDIRTARVGAEMLLEIKDNGTGIKPEHLTRLFDPFFTTKDVGEGTGLGLSISHHIISAHGGRIEVDSQAGRRNLFSHLSAPERRREISHERKPRNTRCWSSMTRWTSATPSTICCAANSTCCKARSAEEGLQLMRENEVHIIMTDQRMPKVTGVELLKSIRTGHPQAIRMLFTGYADMDSVIAAINQGHIFKFLKKPWQPEELEKPCARPPRNMNAWSTMRT